MTPSGTMTSSSGLALNPRTVLTPMCPTDGVPSVIG